MRSVILTHFGTARVLVLWSVVAAVALPVSTSAAGWYTWTGEGNTSQWLDPANWLDPETMNRVRNIKIFFTKGEENYGKVFSKYHGQ